MSPAFTTLHLQKKAVNVCRELGATTPERALEKQRLGIDKGGAMRKLLEHKVLLENESGRIWLDEGEWADYTDARKGMLIVAITITALFLGALYVTRQVLVQMT
jgi:hypothetical protein